jgi:hypothetical protein
VGSWADAIALDTTVELGEAEVVLVCAAAWQEIDPPSDTASAMISEKPAPRMRPPGGGSWWSAPLFMLNEADLEGSPAGQAAVQVARCNFQNRKVGPLWAGFG